MKKPATLHWLVLAACIVIAAGAVLWRSPAQRAIKQRSVSSPLAVIPPGAALVLTIDVPKLAGSPAGKQLAQRGAGLFGLGSDDCAAHALASSRGFALAVDGAAEQLVNPEPSEIAVVASGGFNAEQIAGCAEQALTKKQGDPVRSVIGSFLSVRDRKGRSGEVAVRDGGPLIVSNGRYLRDILDAAEGRSPRPNELQAARDALHTQLRQSFGQGAPVVATVTLPAGWLERMLGDREASLSPLAELRSAALRLEPAGQGFLLEALLSHATPEAATQVEELLRELTAAFKPWLEERTSARTFAQLTPQRDGTNLRLSVLTNQSELERLLTALLPGP